MARRNVKKLAIAAAVTAAFAAVEAQAMPAVVLPAIAAGVLAGSSIATGIGFSMAAFAVSAGLSIVMSAIAGKASSENQVQPSFQSEAQGRTVVVRSSVATRRIVYGQSIVSGPLVYAESTTNGSILYHHYVVPLATHECEEIGDVYFGDELVGTLDGSGNVTSGTFSGYARIKKHLGASDQVADADLVSASAGLWTSAHRLRGICYIYVRLQINSGVFLNGVPNFKAVVKGRKVYDPRVVGSPTVTAWSDNFALCVRDYLTASFGLGCADSEIDDAAIIAAANIADELVATSGASPTPYQKRYTCNGTVDLGNRPRDIMQSLLSAGAGACVYAQGVYRVLAGAYVTPELEITSDWLAGGVKVRPRMARQDLYNAVRGTFSDPDQSWEPTDFPMMTNATYETEDGSIQIPRDIELPFTTDPMAAQRIAKLHLEKGRQSATVQMQCNMKAFRLRVWDTVTLTLSSLGYSNSIFLVTSWAMNEKGTIDIQLQKEASASYDWTYTEGTVLAAVSDVIVVPPIEYDYSTFDPDNKGENVIFTGGSNNLVVYRYAAGGPDWSRSLVFQATGAVIKRYAEFLGDAFVMGIVNSSNSGYGLQNDGQKWNDGVTAAYGSGFFETDYIGVLFDAEIGELSFTINGVSQGVAYTGISGSYCPGVRLSSSVQANFGQGFVFINPGAGWVYAPPAGYVGWTP